MKLSLSIYLDIIRVCAASIVFLSHFSQDRFSGDYFNVFNGIGHDAVIVFFLLSGYVISYIADVKEKKFDQYLTARLGRLYSVILPALFITIGLDFIGTYLNPDFYSGVSGNSNPIYRFMMNFFNLQQLWFLNIRPLSNGPFWSISYEFWYYIIFAAFTFLPPKFKPYIVCTLCIAAGPPIMILFPIWLTGAVLYRFHKNSHLDSKIAVVFFTIGSMGTFSLILAGGRNLFPVFENLNMAKFFLYDWTLGALIALNILSINYLFGHYGRLRNIFENTKVQIPVRHLSGMTFSLYLFHYPIIVFLKVFMDIKTDYIFQVTCLLLLSVLVIYLLSFVTEKQKYLYQGFFFKVVKYFLRYQ